LALYANASNFLSVKDASGFVYGFSESNTADRLYTLQNATGTIPLLQSTQSWTGVNSFTGTNTGFGTSSPSSLALIDAVSTTKGSRPFTQQTTAQIAANYSSILTTTLTSGGTGYTNGSYTNIALTGGTGTGAIASITVAGGIVTVVTITTAGSGYQVADVLSASNATIGGGSGSGLVITVATITTPQGLFVYNSTLGRLGYNNADQWRYLIGSSQTSIPNTQIPFGDANGNLQSSSKLTYNSSTSVLTNQFDASNFTTQTVQSNGGLNWTATSSTAGGEFLISTNNSVNARVLTLTNSAYSGGTLRISIPAAQSFNLRNTDGYGINISPGGSQINTPGANLTIWTQSTNTFDFKLGGIDINPTVARTLTTIQPIGSSGTPFTPTTGSAITYDWIQTGNSAFAPTSGTATFIYQRIRPTINTTGSYTGTVEGFRGSLNNPEFMSSGSWSIP
jgi:hypothetical protein